ncbi:MAG: hypothetical protein ACQEWM_08590 [Actinomycetota bacterium]
MTRRDDRGFDMAVAHGRPPTDAESRDPSSRTNGTLRSLVARHRVISFIALAYLIS